MYILYFCEDDINNPDAESISFETLGSLIIHIVDQVVEDEKKLLPDEFLSLVIMKTKE